MSVQLHKPFGQFSSSKTQRPTVLGPVKVELNVQEQLAGEGFGIDLIDGEIKIKETGMYLIIAGPQISKLKGDQPRWIDFWLRVNNRNVPNSNVRAVLERPSQMDVIITQIVTRLNKDDTVNVMMSVEAADEGLGIEAIQPADEPMIPSMILTILQLQW
ncbi:MAG: hypothetical protein ACREAN_08500, partial [Nitrosopumilaceae archaeon]